MSLYQPERLYQLLPAFYRVRDADQGEPLRALLAVIEGELERVEADTAVLYDNWFIETCDEWVVPYIGDLLGVRPIRAIESAGVQRARLRRQHDRLPAPQGHGGRARTAGARRHRLAGARGRVLPAAGDHAAHEPRAADAHGDAERARRGRMPSSRTARSTRSRTRSKCATRPTRGGRFNIPNVGLFLWRLRSYAVGAGAPGDESPDFASARDLGAYWSDPPGRRRLAAVQRAAHRDDDHPPRRGAERARRAAPAGAERRARTAAPRRRDAGAAVHDRSRSGAARLRAAGRRERACRGAARGHLPLRDPRRRRARARRCRGCWRSTRRAAAWRFPPGWTCSRSGCRAATASRATSAAARTTAVPRCAPRTRRWRSTSRRPATSAASSTPASGRSAFRT